MFRFLFISLFIPVLCTAQNKKHVLLVSIDGFRPDFYQQEKWEAPTLKRLKSQGVYANGIFSVFPSVTYPSHTTIVTGELPCRHGIYYNAPFEGKNGTWYWDEKYIKVPTLWDAVKAGGLTSGSVMWPVTVGAPINYNFPVRRADNDEKTDQLSVTKPFITPAGMLAAMQQSIGELTPKNFNHDNIDITIGRMAAYIIKTHKPNLMAVHFIGLDHAQHDVGREGVEVAHALAVIDSMLNVVLSAYEEAGIKNNTDVIITGDHGFVSVKQNISPNTLLYKAGIITDKDWKARFHSTGGSAFLYLKDPKDTKTLQKVKQLLNDVTPAEKKYFTVIERAELDSMGVNPEVAMALSANNASALNGSTDGALIKPKKSTSGSHGHDPRMPELYTGFIGYGPSFKSGANVEHLRLTDMSALISNILGLKFKEVDLEVKRSIFKN
ncbi:MAG: ectonucleotide pyrophosphatase/phosphodiesterase [Niabella sp.]